MNSILYIYGHTKNKVAQCLSNYLNRIESTMVWIEEIPIFLIQFVNDNVNFEAI